MSREICAILLAAIPVLGQQTAPKPAQGAVDERVVQNAVRDALLNSLKAPRVSAFLKTPDAAAIAMMLGRNVCAVPLLEVPAAKGEDRGIYLKDGTASGDNKMIVPPAAPPCAPDRSR